MSRPADARIVQRLISCTVAIVAAAALSCGHSSTSSSTGLSAGSLTVTISGTTGGLKPTVIVSGPGTSRPVNATSTLTGLPSGSYAISPNAAVDSSPLVSRLYSATVSVDPVEVTAGSTASTTVMYGARGGSGGLWEVGGVDDGGDNRNLAVEYTASQMAATSSVVPAVTLGLTFTLGHNIDPSGAAFDSVGALWVANQNSNDVVAYGPLQLSANGNPAPALTLTGPEMAMPTGLAFDRHGNLWATNIASGTIVEFTAGDLVSSGSPTPAVTIIEDSVAGPAALAFDTAGNLWVSNTNASTLVEYTAASLVAGGSLAPAVTISGLVSPWGIAFDTHGNLWVANSDQHNLNGTIVEYTRAQLTTSGKLVPAVTLTPPGTHPSPTGLAFDNSGNLWYIDINNFSIRELAVAQIGASGSPPAAVIITNTLGGVALAFNPHSSSLWLH